MCGTRLEPVGWQDPESGRGSDKGTRYENSGNHAAESLLFSALRAGTKQKEREVFREN